LRRTEFTYGQLDKVLRSLGFNCQPTKQPPPGRVYQHKASGAIILLPDVTDDEKVFEYHLVAARVEADNFGIAEPKVFDAKLRKAK
jgi:hypothetical protein